MKISYLLSKWIVTFIGLILAGSVHANLIVNGGFEDNQVANGSWNFFSANNVNGWEGSNIEIWHNFSGVVAAEGQQHAELNAHPNTGNVFSIFQDFSTVVGQTYDVSFFYRARESDKEAFRFSLGTLNTVLTDHVVGAWSTFTNSFVADTTLSRLRFTSLDASTTGNLIDGVFVGAHVPEPSSTFLFIVGLFSLGLARRKVKA